MTAREQWLVWLRELLDAGPLGAGVVPGPDERRVIADSLLSHSASVEGNELPRLARRIVALASALLAAHEGAEAELPAQVGALRYALGVVAIDGTDEGLPELGAANTAMDAAPVPEGVEMVPADVESPELEPAASAADDDDFMIIVTRGTTPVSPEFAAQFAVEALEALAGCESCLLSLEAEPGDKESTDAAFRHLHSFKGNCGFLGLARMEAVAHAAESVLSLVKDGKLPLTHTTASLLLETLDAFGSAMHGGFERDEVPNGGALLERLEACQDGALSSSTHPSPALRVQEHVVSPSPSSSVASSEELPVAPLAAAESAHKPRAEAATLRVDAARLDELLDLVGELITGGMAVGRVVAEPTTQQEGANAVAQLDRVVRAMQDAVMSLRMVPVEGTFRRMIRVVRDVALKQGKEVELVREGEETEIDKRVAEQLADPLVHLMRNAVDHAIEPPEDRVRAGKPRVGEVRLGARHMGGEVWITVQDDGRGLDRARLLARAIERGLVKPERAEAMSDAEVYGLIFEPGFSTAAAITDVSGRGVGMDVVRRNIEEVKGRIEVSTVLGKGTLFTIRIPLTLAIVEGMLVRVGASSFTIPLNSIRESVRPRVEDLTSLSTGAEMVSIRDHMLPVLRISRLYGIPTAVELLDRGILVVVEHDGKQLCLFVDELVGQRQTVVKNLSGFLGTVPGLAGCTVLGDGRISLILDVPALMAAQGRPTRAAASLGNPGMNGRHVSSLPMDGMNHA